MQVIQRSYRVTALFAFTLSILLNQADAQIALTKAKTPASSSTGRRLPHNLTPQHLNTHWEPEANSDSDPLPQKTGRQNIALGLKPTASQVRPANHWVGNNGHVVSDVLEPLEMNPTANPTGVGQVTAANHVTQQACCGPDYGAACQDGQCGSLLGHGGMIDDGPVVNLGPEVLPGLGLDHLSVFAGVHGTKSAANRGQDGSFGFHEGFNIGTPARNIVLPPSVGLQLGFAAAQSNLEGSAFDTNERYQYFLTVGGFRRADYGLQGGLVFDYLWDDWNYELTVGQLRGEISMALSERASYGFSFSAPVEKDTVLARVDGVSTTESWETLDVYAIFFRSRMLGGGRGEGRVYAGLTGESDGIIGADTKMPLINGWALETEFMYLVPDNAGQLASNQNESWNVAFGLAWYPGSLACGDCIRYHRPLMDVANNGSMILRRSN